MMKHFIFIIKNVKYWHRNKKSSKFPAFKFLIYNSHKICLFGSTCVSVNTIYHKGKNFTKILLFF